MSPFIVKSLLGCYPIMQHLKIEKINKNQLDGTHNFWLIINFNVRLKPVDILL
jgi:hypothetical protein